MSNEHIQRPLLVEIGGETFTFKPLNVSDITGPVTDYFKMQPVAELIAQKDAFDEQVYDELMKQTKEEASKIEVGTAAFNEQLTKMKNLYYMFWLSMRKTHPQIKKKEFDEMVLNDHDAAKTLLENLGRIIAIADSEPKAETNSDEEGSRVHQEGAKKKTPLTI